MPFVQYFIVYQRIRVTFDSRGQGAPLALIHICELKLLSMRFEVLASCSTHFFVASNEETHAIFTLHSTHTGKLSLLNAVVVVIHLQLVKLVTSLVVVVNHY